MTSTDNSRDPSRQNSKQCMTGTNQVNNKADCDCQKTIQLFRYISKCLCPVLETGHHHSVVTDIKDQELSKSAYMHTRYHSIVKNINKR